MITKVYSVYDDKAALWLPPFCFRNDAEAMRAFTATARDTNTSIGQHPADFCLFNVGEFNDATGELICASPKQSLGYAVEMLAVVAADHPQDMFHTLEREDD